MEYEITIRRWICVSLAVESYVWLGILFANYFEDYYFSFRLEPLSGMLIAGIIPCGIILALPVLCLISRYFYYMVEIPHIVLGILIILFLFFTAGGNPLMYAMIDYWYLTLILVVSCIRFGIYRKLIKDQKWMP